MKTSKSVSEGSKAFSFHFGAFSIDLGYDFNQFGLTGGINYDRSDKVLNAGLVVLVFSVVLSYDFDFVGPA